MKKELLPADATTIEALYERGDNLTFQWDIPDAMNYIVDLRRDDSSGFWIASKTARLELDETCIQFFSDGTLVFSNKSNPQKNKRFEKNAAKKKNNKKDKTVCSTMTLNFFSGRTGI